MEVIRIIMQLLGLVLSVYSFLIFIRIILTWFPGSDFGQIGEFLGRATDPYINWFRRLSFLRIGAMDLSVIAALITLWIVRSIVTNIAFMGTITFGIILAIVVDAIAGAFFFFLTLFLILAVVRFLGSVLGANTASRFWIALDQILEPIIYRVITPLAREKSMTYQTGLLLFVGLDLVAIFGGRLLIGLLVSLLRGLPF
jgi:YggT family protein